MKVEINKGMDVFQPITLTITMETWEEAMIIRGIWGANPRTAAVIKELALFLEDVPIRRIEEVLNTTFEPLAEELRRREFI